MKIFANDKLINRNKKISQYILFISFAVLLAGFVLTFNNPDPSKLGWAYLILIPGYILVQISIYFANRWGRSPRPDEIISQSLKGLDDKYSLFHYKTEVSHLLIGPAGIWIIIPYYQSGQISYDSQKKRYRQKGGGNIFTKTFGQEGIGDIEHNSKLQRNNLKKYFTKLSIPYYTKFNVINIFYDEKVDLVIKNAPDPTLRADKLKSYLRKYAKKNPANNDEIEKIIKKLPNN